MDKKILLTLIIGMFLISFASASIENFGTFEKNKDITLLQVTSIYDDCNITSVYYPNSTQALGEVEMTQSGNEFSYVYNQTEVSGQYKVNGVCETTNSSDTFSYYFEVTDIQDKNLVIIAFIVSLLIGGLLYSFLYDRDESGHLILISGGFFIVAGLISILYLNAFWDKNLTNMLGYLIIGIGLIIFGDAIWRLFPNG